MFVTREDVLLGTGAYFRCTIHNLMVHGVKMIKQEFVAVGNGFVC